MGGVGSEEVMQEKKETQVEISERIERRRKEERRGFGKPPKKERENPRLGERNRRVKGKKKPQTTIKE